MKRLLQLYVAGIVLVNFLTIQVSAETLEEFLNKAKEVCLKNITLTTEELAIIDGDSRYFDKMATSKNLPCFMHCLDRQANLIDDKGQLHENALVETLMEKYKVDKQAIIKHIAKCKPEFLKGTDECQKAFNLAICIYSYQ